MRVNSLALAAVAALLAMLVPWCEHAGAAKLEYAVSVNSERGLVFAELEPGWHDLTVSARVVDSLLGPAGTDGAGLAGGLLQYSFDLAESFGESVQFETVEKSYGAAWNTTPHVADAFAVQFAGAINSRGGVVAETGSISPSAFHDFGSTFGVDDYVDLVTGRFYWDGAPTRIDLTADASASLVYGAKADGGFWGVFPESSTGLTFTLGDPALVVDPPVVEPPIAEPPVVAPPVVTTPVVEPPVIDPPAVEPPVISVPPIEPAPADPALTEPPVADPAATDRQVITPGFTDPSRIDLVIDAINQIDNAGEITFQDLPGSVDHGLVRLSDWLSEPGGQVVYLDVDATDWLSAVPVEVTSDISIQVATTGVVGTNLAIEAQHAIDLQHAVEAFTNFSQSDAVLRTTSAHAISTTALVESVAAPEPSGLAVALSAAAIVGPRRRSRLRCNRSVAGST